MKPYLKTKDYSVTGEGFELLYDETLDMLVTQPQPLDLDKYYKSQNYISHTDANKTFTDKLYQTVKTYNLRNKLKLISTLGCQEKTLLDVGAGTGDFVLAATKMGWKTDGVEPNPDARLRAGKKRIVLVNNLQELPDKKYSVITLWHVLEHVPDPKNQIRELVSRLTEDGALVIAVPNFKSYDAKVYGKYWAAYDVPRHLWHFSRTSIERLFAAQGMKLVKVKPMIFDSFYVSLLSEKYKTGHKNYFRAFAIGLLSNLRGLGRREYSSHIYILKRA